MRVKGEERRGFPRERLVRALFALQTALLLATLALDLVGVLADAPAWYRAGKHAGGAGVVVGVLAFVLALVSYIGGARAAGPRKRGLRGRLVAGLIALMLFAAAYWVRGGPGVPPDPPILWLEGLGALCLLYATSPGRPLGYRGRAGAEDG